MYKITTLYIAILFTVLACNNEKTNISQKYLNIDNLTTQAFFVNTKKDTTLITKQGVIIKIAAYSIKSNGDNVTLEVKEALSLYDIIRAGLTTSSEQGILSSDGMFYINTKESSTIKKPLLISVPTVFTDDSMQLYKGEDVNGKLYGRDQRTFKKLPHQIMAKHCLKHNVALAMR